MATSPPPDLEGEEKGGPSPYVEVRTASFNIYNNSDTVRCPIAPDNEVEALKFPVGKTFGLQGSTFTVNYYFKRQQFVKQGGPWVACFVLKLMVGPFCQLSILSKAEVVVTLNVPWKLSEWKRLSFSLQDHFHDYEDFHEIKTAKFVVPEDFDHDYPLSAEIQLKLSASQQNGHNGAGPIGIVNAFRASLSLDMGTDVVLKVPMNNEQGQFYERKAHKGILMARSPVFAIMFAPRTGMLEEPTGEVIIKDLSPIGLDVLLDFIYFGEVAEEWKQVPQDVLNIAEKYEFPYLKYFCDKNLSSICKIENALELGKLAKLHGLEQARKGVEWFISNNVRNILDNSPQL